MGRYLKLIESLDDEVHSPPPASKSHRCGHQKGRRPPSYEVDVNDQIDDQARQRTAEKVLIMMTTEKIGTGKWREPGVPHNGWRCVDVEDLADQRAICAMCEVAEIRYAHHLRHLDYPHTLAVGCICAMNMESNYSAPAERERRLRNLAGRRNRWLGRRWRTSRNGNSFLRIDDFVVVIFPRRSGGFGGMVEHRPTGRKVWAKQIYPDADTVKLAAFNAMVEMKPLIEKEKTYEYANL